MRLQIEYASADIVFAMPMLLFSWLKVMSVKTGELPAYTPLVTLG